METTLNLENNNIDTLLSKLNIFNTYVVDPTVTDIFGPFITNKNIEAVCFWVCQDNVELMKCVDIIILDDATIGSFVIKSQTTVPLFYMQNKNLLQITDTKRFMVAYTLRNNIRRQLLLTERSILTNNVGTKFDPNSEITIS